MSFLCSGRVLKFSLARESVTFPFESPYLTWKTFSWKLPLQGNLQENVLTLPFPVLCFRWDLVCSFKTYSSVAHRGMQPASFPVSRTLALQEALCPLAPLTPSLAARDVVSMHWAVLNLQ